MTKENTTQEEIDALELRTEEVQEILGTPPRWLVRWGISVIVLSILSLLVVSWFVQYPDIIRAEIIITTQQPPVKVVAPTSGNITAILIEDNETVVAKQRLAILKSVANFEHIFELEEKLLPITNLEPDFFLNLQFETGKNLGELQQDYASFLQYLDNYQLYLSEQTNLKQIPFLKQEIGYYQNLSAVLLSKDSILKQETDLAKKLYDRETDALKIGGGTRRATEKAKIDFLEFESQQKETRISLLNHQITINKLNSQISDIRAQTQDAGKERFILVKESFKRLKSQLKTWLQNYVLEAPIAGKASFHNYWSPQQFVAANTPVMTIVPQTSNLIGKVLLAIEGSGKVAENQSVNIKLSAFPYREYGIVKGTIKKIALAPYEETYAVEVALPNGLQTTYKKDLHFRQQMKGSAEIITKDRRLLERLLESLIWK